MTASRVRPDYSQALDVERLERPTNRTAFVVETAVGNPTPVRIETSTRIEADPLALGLPRQVDGEVGVDENERSPGHDGADSVAEVGRSERTLQRRGDLSGDNRHCETHPDRGRAQLCERT